MKNGKRASEQDASLVWQKKKQPWSRVGGLRPDIDRDWGFWGWSLVGLPRSLKPPQIVRGPQESGNVVGLPSRGSPLIRLAGHRNHQLLAQEAPESDFRPRGTPGLPRPQKPHRRPVGQGKRPNGSRSGYAGFQSRTDQRPRRLDKLDLHAGFPGKRGRLPELLLPAPQAPGKQHSGLPNEGFRLPKHPGPAPPPPRQTGPPCRTPKQESRLPKLPRPTQTVPHPRVPSTGATQPIKRPFVPGEQLRGHRNPLTDSCRRLSQTGCLPDAKAMKMTGVLTF